jgi:hypothetical protein
MHIHMPKSLHGWGEFAWEVFIIVIGVLIALGAEQGVERMTWRHRVNEAKEDLRAELQDDLFGAQERVRNKECIDRRLARLSDLIDHPPPAAWKLAGVVPIRPWSSSVWDSALASGAVSHMLADDRARYTQVYSMIKILREMNLDEYTTGAELRMLERGGPIGDITQDRLRAIVAKLQGYNSIIPLGAAQLSDAIRATGTAVSSDDERRLANEPCPMPNEPAPER